jgi:hypothetical protein
MHNAQARTKRIINHLEDKLQLLQMPSPYGLSQVMAFITGLQDPWYEADRIAVLKRIAEYVVSTMNIHMLNLLAIFKEKAEEEGIRSEDREETLNYVLPVITRVTGEVSTRLSVQSLDDLAALINITVRLQVLSRTDSADEAQNWLYELPAMYQRQLTNEDLQVTQYPSHFTSWSSNTTTGNYEISEPMTRMTMPTGTTGTGPLSPPVRVSFKTDTQFTASEA